MVTLQLLIKLTIFNFVAILPLCLCHGQVVSSLNVDESNEYLIAHYWDDFDLSDPALFGGNRQSIVIAEYIKLLELSSDTTLVKRSIYSVLNRAQEINVSVFEAFISSMEYYLYDCDSQMRNEELYIPVLQFIVESDSIANIDKLRAKYQLALALKNRVGDVAADFKYITNDGGEGSMHAIKSEYLLLFFYSPDCKDCKKLKRELAGSQAIKDLYQDGLLKILAIDVDADIELWRRASYPDMMINGYDNLSDIISKSLYNLQIIPSLYLLDAQKRVVLKECAVEDVDSWICREVIVEQ